MAGMVRAAMTGEYMVTGGFVVQADSHVHTGPARRDRVGTALEHGLVISSSAS
jgi:hypothetical protein